MKGGQSGQNGHGECCRLKVFSLGMAIGITTGLWMLLLGWLSWLMGWGHNIINIVEPLYRGYGPSFVGGLIGGLWGLVDGFFFGIIIAFIYNQCLKCGICRAK